MTERGRAWVFTGVGGLLREGLAADLVVFDPDRVAPLMPEVVDDLPAGARGVSSRRRYMGSGAMDGRRPRGHR